MLKLIYNFLKGILGHTQKQPKINYNSGYYQEDEIINWDNDPDNIYQIDDSNGQPSNKIIYKRIK